MDSCSYVTLIKLVSNTQILQSLYLKSFYLGLSIRVDLFFYFFVLFVILIITLLHHLVITFLLLLLEFFFILTSLHIYTIYNLITFHISAIYNPIIMVVHRMLLDLICSVVCACKLIQNKFSMTQTSNTFESRLYHVRQCCRTSTHSDAVKFIVLQNKALKINLV